MRIKVKYMAVAREITGSREETIETKDSCTVMALLGMLSQKYGGRMRDYLFDPTTGRPHSHLQFLLDGSPIELGEGFETAIPDESTLVIIPPVSGG